MFISTCLSIHKNTVCKIVWSTLCIMWVNSTFCDCTPQYVIALHIWVHSNIMWVHSTVCDCLTNVSACYIIWVHTTLCECTPHLNALKHYVSALCTMCTTHYATICFLICKWLLQFYSHRPDQGCHLRQPITYFITTNGTEWPTSLQLWCAFISIL